MTRPPGRMSIKQAAYQGTRDAYRKASGDGRLPTKARQVMYAARPEILRLTRVEKFGDSYVMQVLLPDYLNEHTEDTGDWDVIYDARGHFTEPNTGIRIPLGTLQVRQYL